ncbi:hypothetical protein PFICI_05820 [Pestalotiopsis fici W106-1]|uniref:Major facilitator superfamily (MFS) profile domain-containing protein n=1 Tax=Pestalotiopsis fici (strain W106-1 / CGMCC3.15140) TaxID=1229662 RepID=W3XD53_PESFW|nr:uncharacterized protein PFICI_05820 [Pestalotiopsis fici W106-1]ETS83944.1 hypothetical protein PFICI_05820 [Pestalotiopsis fici W106-1]
MRDLPHMDTITTDAPHKDNRKAATSSAEHVADGSRDLAEDLSSDEIYFVENYGEERRRKVIRKVDIRLVPVLALLYLMSYIDRANIGNAKIEGLAEDLNLSGSQYNIALSLFFVPYILLEIPSNIVLGYFARPSRYIGGMIAAWGAVMTLTGLVRNFGGLVAARWFLGVFEAGFFPAAIYIISRWYLPNERQVRIALFYSASAVAGAFSGLLAFAIAKMDGVAGLEGWRWIFIIEGLVSVACGILAWFCLIDTPALSGRWLEPEEIRYLELRQLAIQGNGARVREAEKSRKWQIAKSVLLDWQLYLQALVYWSNTAPNYGLKFTMPQIIKNMGFTSSNAQLLTIPPYFMGAVSAYVSAIFADRFRWRMPFIVGAQTLVMIAFIILFVKAADVKNNIAVCYFAVILSCIGFYPINPGGNAWTVDNLAGPTKRAQGVAFMIGMGNIGGIIGSYIYIDSEAPRYPTGFSASLAFAALGIVCCLALEFGYWRQNKKRAQMTEDEIRAKYTDEELEGMGDSHDREWRLGHQFTPDLIAGAVPEKCWWPIG